MQQDDDSGLCMELYDTGMIEAVLRHVETVARETEVAQAGVQLAQNAVVACNLADFDSFSKDLHRL